MFVASAGGSPVRKGSPLERGSAARERTACNELTFPTGALVCGHAGYKSSRDIRIPVGLVAHARQSSARATAMHVGIDELSPGDAAESGT